MCSTALEGRSFSRETAEVTFGLLEAGCPLYRGWPESHNKPKRCFAALLTALKNLRRFHAVKTHALRVRLLSILPSKQYAY